jgi:hypothetical protein
MISGVPDVGCHPRSDASRDKYGWELVLQCLDSQQKIHAEDISTLKLVLTQLNESYDILKRELQDDKMSLRLELLNFREDFRSYCSTACPACNHRANHDDASSSPMTNHISAVEESLEPESSEVPATTPAILNMNYPPQDFTFHSTQPMIFNSDILMVLKKYNPLECIGLDMH